MCGGADDFVVVTLDSDGDSVANERRRCRRCQIPKVE
jgi:hypothetical protein